MHRLILNALFLSFTAFSATAQAEDAPGVYIIYDSSNSMWGALPDGSRKYEAARAAMNELASQEFNGAEVALRMYGHRRKDDCSDSELVIGFSNPAQSQAAMIDAMSAVRPTGRTPIDLSLRQALADFGPRSGTIILISDGIESCDADPCALVRAWRNKDVKIDVHVVGLGLTGKERAAMQCISDAAGTPYRDAFSASELADTLTTTVSELGVGSGETPVPGTPDPAPQTTEPDFALVVETADGARQRGAGVLIAADGQEFPVESFARYTPEPGDYLLRAGVQLVSGEVYQPVETPVTILESGRTIGRVVTPTPPSVAAAFSMEGEELRATVVRVYRDGKQIGSFKGDAMAFVPEATLDFRSKLAGTSADTVVTETFASGAQKVIRFEADIEVRLNVFAIAIATGDRLKGKPTTELWQDGAQVDKINRHSGGLVRPGTYRLVIDDGLNHFETALIVSTDKLQEPRFEVPSAAITVDYVGLDGAPEAPKRVFLENLETGSRATRTSGAPIALTPGRYSIEGWPKQNGYPEREISVVAGQDQTITLRSTK